MWGKYERGVAMPGGEVLSKLAQLGVDVVYVLTGEPSPGSAPLLNREHAALIDNYEHCTAEDQAAARRFIAAAAQSRRAIIGPSKRLLNRARKA